MTVISGIHKETHVEYGAILTTGKKGFDFSLFDEEYNTIKIRNSFVGNPGRYNGETPLLALNKKVLKADGSTFSRKRDWKDKLDSLAGCRERILSAKNNVIRLSGKYNLATGLSLGMIC